MDLTRDLHEEDDSFYTAEYFDSGSIEFLDLTVDLPEDLYTRLMDEEILVLGAEDIRQFYHGGERVIPDIITQVVTFDQEVTWRAYIKHTGTRLRPMNVKRSVFERFLKEGADLNHLDTQQL